MFFFHQQDHNLHTVREIRDHKLFIAESLRMLVQDAEAAESSGARTLGEKVGLYFRRFCFITLYIAIQIGGMVLIVITLAGQSPSIKQFGNWVALQTDGALEITPIVVGIVNAIVPQLTTRLLKQEKYDDQGTVIKQTVLRIFLTKTFNILIQVMSYLLLQDPFLFSSMETIFLKNHIFNKPVTLPAGVFIVCALIYLTKTDGLKIVSE